MNSGEQSVREIKIKNLIRVIEKAMDKASAYSSERGYAEQLEQKETEQENFNTQVKNILNETNKKFRSWCIDLKKNDLFDFFKDCTVEACSNYFQGILTQLREYKSKFDRSSKTKQDNKTIYNRSGSNKFRKKKRWRGITIIILFPLLAVLLTCFNIKFEEPIKDLGIILQALFVLLTSGDGIGIITTWAGIVREVKDDNEKGIQYGEQRAVTSSELLKNEIGYNVMAKSLSHSCYSSKENAQAGIFSREYASRIKKKLQDGFQYRHVVFISAVSKDSNGQPTKEFKLAQILRDKLKEKNIGVFWWEDDDVTDSSITVSTKIAMGLSCSTFFVGLSFGDRSKICNGEEFAWQRDERYKFFKYEINTFLELSDGHIPKPNYICGWESRYFPKSWDRICLLYTDASIANITESSPFSDRDDVIHSVDDDDERIVNGIVAYIETKINNKLNEGNKHYKKIYNWIHKHSDNCSTKPQDSQCENRFLYDAFDPNEFARGNFMDHFLGPQWEGEAWIRADSKENIDSIPIDYFFQYAIVDEAGRNAKNHFLVFPERYNDGNGNFKWRMKLVIRDWNLRALQDDNYRRFLLGNISYNPRPAKDSRFPLSDYSVIKFYKDKNLFNRSDDGLDDVSFDEHATCQIYSDNKVGAAQNLTECNSGNENHCAFILYDDMLNEVRPTYHLAGSLQLCNAVSANDGKYFYISVMFYPKPWEYNITRVKLSTRTKTARCPYCGRIRTLDSKLAGDDMDHSKYCYSNEQIVNGRRYQTCEYNFIGKFYPLDDSGTMKRSKAIGGSEEVYGDFSNELLREYENIFNKKEEAQHALKALPNDDIKLVYKDYKDGIVVTMVGVSKSGKSTFISRMLGVYSEGDYEGNIFCEYLNNAMKPYVGEVAFAQVKTLELFKQRGQDIPNKHGINGIRLLEDYKTPKYQQFLKSTQNGEPDPILTHIPFTVELRGIQSNRDKESFVSFFDLPGGLLESSGNLITQYHKDFTMLYQSDSIILLLSDDQEEKEKIQTMLTAIKDVNEDTVVAIVFCKSDILFGNTQYHWDKVRGSSPVAKGNKFNGSKRQRYIDECSKEIKDKMERYGSALMKKTINELTKHFAAHHKFFAVSALGRGDSIICQKSGNKNKYTLFETSPLNIENVLLWIMFEKGIIE